MFLSLLAIIGDNVLTSGKSSAKDGAQAEDLESDSNTSSEYNESQHQEISLDL